MVTWDLLGLQRCVKMCHLALGNMLVAASAAVVRPVIISLVIVRDWKRAASVALIALVDLMCSIVVVVVVSVAWGVQVGKANARVPVEQVVGGNAGAIFLVPVQS